MKSVGGQVTYLKAHHIVMEKPFRGIYQGVVQGKFGPQFCIRAIEGVRVVTNEQGQIFHQPLIDGEDVILNSNGALKYKMARIKEGSEVTIKYLGQKVIPSGNYAGSNFHDMDVLTDEANILFSPNNLDLMGHPAQMGQQPMGQQPMGQQYQPMGQPQYGEQAYQHPVQNQAPMPVQHPVQNQAPMPVQQAVNIPAQQAAPMPVQQAVNIPAQQAAPMPVQQSVAPTPVQQAVNIPAQQAAPMPAQQAINATPVQQSVNVPATQQAVQTTPDQDAAIASMINALNN